MKEIIKKCNSNLFEKILKGEKTFEVRLEDDCEFNEGDILVIKEVDDKRKETGRKIKKKIGFILRTKNCKFWEKEDIDKYGYTIMSLLE